MFWKNTIWKICFWVSWPPIGINFTHPTNPTGVTKQIQLAQQRSRPSPFHQEGGHGLHDSTVSDGIRGIVT